jgi:uncharacterized protein
MLGLARLRHDDRFGAWLAGIALNLCRRLHPGSPLPAVQQAYYSGFSPEVTAQFSLAGWGWHHEAGIHVLRLISSGLWRSRNG